MAEDDEIDILGDFSFDSCLAQNSQGIPSGSDRENTVHPQWLLDGTATNWYDFQNRANRTRTREGPPRVLSGDRHARMDNSSHTSWSPGERELLTKEMAKYGRDIRKIAQTIKTKSAAEIQALIEAEYGVNLDTPSFGLEKTNIEDDMAVVQEEVVADDDMTNVKNMVTTGSPTVPRVPFKKKNKPKNSLIKPEVLLDIKKTNDLIAINPAEILYEDDLILGSTESVGAVELDITKKLMKNSDKLKPKVLKKIGNHRRKYSRNYEKSPKPRNRSMDKFKSPGRQRKDSNLSEESKSPKMQIVFSSGHALPVSEGEQVIKIEKKKDSDPESDIDIDVDSDDDSSRRPGKERKGLQDKEERVERIEQRGEEIREEAPVTVPLEVVPGSRRQKKINLDGDGGYTITHSASGDVCVGRGEPAPRKPKPKPKPAQLVPCRVYNKERPAPYEVRLCVSALIAMDAHAHTSRAEVMGLLGGRLLGGGGRGGAEGGGGGGALLVAAYCPAAAAASGTHCDMDPVSQAAAAELISARGLWVCGWHHSHPVFAPSPSPCDLATQGALQQALGAQGARPILGAITAQHWPPGREHSQYKCFRVESTPEEPEVGYQFSVKLVPDITPESLPTFLEELRRVLRGEEGCGGSPGRGGLEVDLARDVCPLAGRTYLEKCISSVSHHLLAAGYAPTEPLIHQLAVGLRDIFR